MRKTLIAMSAAAVMSMLASAPASAFAPIFFVPALLAKQDKNFKAVNPYAKPVAVRHGKHKRGKH